MQTNDLIKALSPVLELSVEANILSRTLYKHYIKTIAELTGKTEDTIAEELNEIEKTVKASVSDKISLSK